MPNFLHSKTIGEPVSSSCESLNPSAFLKQETIPARVLEEKIIESQVIQIEEAVNKEEQVAGNMQNASPEKQIVQPSPRSI